MYFECIYFDECPESICTHHCEKYHSCDCCQNCDECMLDICVVPKLPLGLDE